MNAPSYEPGRAALMLSELRLPTIRRLWPQFAERSDKEGWPAARFLGGLLEHELAERAKRRIEGHRAESQLDPTKTLASFEFAEVAMLSKAHVMALASGDAWIEKGATVLIFGPPGVGKSHVGCGLGHALIDAGYRVLSTCAPASWCSACRPHARACNCPKHWQSWAATTCSFLTICRLSEKTRPRPACCSN